jgi:hypothetical protein
VLVAAAVDTRAPAVVVSKVRLGELGFGASIMEAGMGTPFREVTYVHGTQSVPERGPCTQPLACEGTPIVPRMLLDDVGYRWG